MASVEAEPSNCSHHFVQSFCVSEENLCVNYFSMKDHIQGLTTKLKSAQLIIKILLKSKVSEPMNTENLPSCVNFNSQAKNNSEKWK